MFHATKNFVEQVPTIKFMGRARFMAFQTVLDESGTGGVHRVVDDVHQPTYACGITDPDWKLKDFFSYRKTSFPSGDGVIIEAELDLEKGEVAEVHRTMDDHLSRRSSTQPLNMPNSGSIFKNPSDDKAGRLIESVGLKGYSIGGASVSIKHANFIVNKGNASAGNVVQLIEHIQKVVEEKTGTKLEQEIVIIGE